MLYQFKDLEEEEEGEKKPVKVVQPSMVNLEKLIYNN